MGYPSSLSRPLPAGLAAGKGGYVLTPGPVLRIWAYDFEKKKAREPEPHRGSSHSRPISARQDAERNGPHARSFDQDHSELRAGLAPRAPKIGQPGAGCSFTVETEAQSGSGMLENKKMFKRRPQDMPRVPCRRGSILLARRFAVVRQNAIDEARFGLPGLRGNRTIARVGGHL